MLIALFFFTVTSYAQNHCVDIFTKPASLNLAQQYLELAEKELWLESLETLPHELILSMVDQYSGRYNIPSSARDQKTFYLNTISSHLSRTGWEWKKQEIRSLLGYLPSGKSLLTAQALMDSFYSTQGMVERLNKARLLEFFRDKPWQELDWSGVMKVVEAWHTSPESQKGFTYFYKWYETQKDLPALSFNDLQRVYMALMKKPSPVICCKASFACKICPHNRAWLREKD